MTKRPPGKPISAPIPKPPMGWAAGRPSKFRHRRVAENRTVTFFSEVHPQRSPWKLATPAARSPAAAPATCFSVGAWRPAEPRRVDLKALHAKIGRWNALGKNENVFLGSPPPHNQQGRYCPEAQGNEIDRHATPPPAAGFEPPPRPIGWSISRGTVFVT